MSKVDPIFPKRLNYPLCYLFYLERPLIMVIIGVERESDDDNKVSEINAVARDKLAKLTYGTRTNSRRP